MKTTASLNSARSISLGGTATLDIGDATGATLSGTLSSTGALAGTISGAFGLTKSGTGTLLDGVSGYSGGALVQAGTLNVRTTLSSSP